MGAGPCGDEMGRYCHGDLGASSILCLTHHASQEAHTDREFPADPSTGGGEPSVHWTGLVRPSSRSRPSVPGRARQRVRRLHARVGVWLE